MQPELTLRLLDPALLLAGIGLAAMAACAFVVARRFGIAHLYVAATCLLVAALPWLVKGGIDTLVWFGFVGVDAYPPDFIVSTVAGLWGYAVLLAACSVVAATFRLLRQLGTT